jgi:hypothetical protein
MPCFLFQIGCQQNFKKKSERDCRRWAYRTLNFLQQPDNRFDRGSIFLKRPAGGYRCGAVYQNKGYP